ncbi:hypothetical protein AgCh_012897 [Apium graveolens]
MKSTMDVFYDLDWDKLGEDAAKDAGKIRKQKADELPRQHQLYLLPILGKTYLLPPLPRLKVGTLPGLNPPNSSTSMAIGLRWNVSP